MLLLTQPLSFDERDKIQEMRQSMQICSRDMIQKLYSGIGLPSTLICSIMKQNDGVNDTRDLGPLPPTRRGIH